MKHGEGEKREAFEQALKGKRIPILTLDNKWYKLLTEEARAEVAGLEEELNALLKRQGKLNAEIKEIVAREEVLRAEIDRIIAEIEVEA